MQAHTPDQYLGALQGLMPHGPVWPRDPDAVQTRLLGVAADGLSRLEQLALQLLEEADPLAAFQMLAEWEGNLGLPDPCSGPADSLQGRRTQIYARETAQGGQSAAYYITVAAALGYSITVTEYAPSRLGAYRLGTPLLGADWAFVWSVQAPTATLRYFRLGASSLGERLSSFSNAVLECVLNRLKPAHTILIFKYSVTT